jgi:acetyl-CoA decarbonylase/synthase complex subunit gamma
MAFATKLANWEATLDKCPPLQKPEYRNRLEALNEMLKPPVQEVSLKSKTRTVEIGGKLVMYRHEFTYFNPTAIAIDVHDEMEEQLLNSRVNAAQGFSYEYIGQRLKLDLIAVRSTSNDPKTFELTVKKIVAQTDLPLILCSENPDVLEAGIVATGGGKPLLYTATKRNWRQMVELALMYGCPLTVTSPFDLQGLKSLVKTLKESGVKELVIDPGVSWKALPDTVNNFTMIRRAACKFDDELMGLPILGVPAQVWVEEDSRPEISAWREACLSSMLITRYADALIMHTMEGWALLPIVILRQNLYTDPRKPVAVEPGLRTFGNPSETSPVLFTTNFALTYYTVASDIESGKVDCHLLVVDTEGLSVESAVAGRKLTADKVAESLKETEVEKKVSHKTLIIPGRAARISGELEELSGWSVLVGPMDSSGIPKFIQEKWAGRT